MGVSAGGASGGASAGGASAGGASAGGDRPARSAAEPQASDSNTIARPVAAFVRGERWLRESLAMLVERCAPVSPTAYPSRVVITWPP